MTNNKFVFYNFIMVMEIEEFAPAKVNIGLKVLAKTEEEPYHQIESIFQTVSLKDRLITTTEDDYNKCSVNCKQFALPEDNTITRAYKAFKEVTGLENLKSVHVELEKQIPSGGGLGGGSSDAVSMVKALEKIHGIRLDSFQQEKIAGKIGSDVFFFFHCNSSGKGCAVVSGRGEKVNDIEPRSDLSFVLVFPKIHSSTKEAYRLVDDYYASGKYAGVRFPALNELKEIYTTSINRWNFVNSFTVPLTERHQEIENALRFVRQSGALFSDMSGSGSTVFGIFDSKEDSFRAVDMLNSKGFESVVAE